MKRIKFKANSDKAKMIRHLEIAVKQWEEIREKGLTLDHKHNMLVEHNGLIYHSAEWSAGCILCSVYKACEDCPMYGRWTYPENNPYNSCNASNSSYNRWQKHQSYGERKVAASVVLSDLKSCLEEVRNTVPDEDKVRKFKLKPVSELVRMDGMRLLFEGRKIVHINDREYGDTITGEMIDEDATIQLTLDQYYEMIGTGEVEWDGYHYSERWLEEVK